MGRLLRHIANIGCVLVGVSLIKFGIWLGYLPLTSFCVILGLTFVYCGTEDYINAVRKWLEKRKREKEEQERRERLKKLLELEEKRREEQRRKTAELFKFIEKPIKFPEIKVETTGEILKRLGVKRESRRKAKPKKKIEIKKPKTEKKKPSTLEPLIQELLTKGELYIDRNMHYGKLRGKDIARALARELKRKGIVGFSIKWGDYDATVKIKEEVRKR